MNSHPLFHLPPEIPGSSAVASHAENDEEQGRLLELRTEAGSVFVCPTRWQSLRLRWIFRNFHVLPQLVLGPGDLRLIEKLSQLPAVAPPPPGSKAVIGVIEQPRARSAAAAHQVLTMAPRNLQSAPRWTPPLSILPEKLNASYRKPAAPARGSRRIADAPFRQWGALSMLAAVSAVVIVVRLYLVPPAIPVQTTTVATTSLPVNQKALPAPPRTLDLSAGLQPTLAPAPLIAYERPRHWFAPAGPAPVAAQTHRSAPVVAESTAAALPTKSVAILPFAAKPVFVSELPQGHFASPVASDPKEVGELRLKALIAADGSVKDVTLVSGDPKLAEAGMRAVRRWRYNPYQASDRETLINMKFFGDDAVSVTSAAR